MVSIGRRAFAGCSSLKSVKLPPGLEALSDEVFSGCKALARAELPAGLKSIGRESFSGCAAINAIKIPGTVESIGADAFSGCESLKSIDCVNPVLLNAGTVRNSPYGEKRRICSHCGAKLRLFGGCSRCKKPRKYK